MTSAASDMGPCYVCSFFFFVLSLHVSTAVWASRSLDLSTDVGVGSSLSLRSLLDRQDEPMSHAKLPHTRPHKDRLSQGHNGANWRELSEKLMARQMGSKPPNCVDKCGMCWPCEAVEVPISNEAVHKGSKDGHLSNAEGAQPADTNYMPESWRCYCANVYYNP